MHWVFKSQNPHDNVVFNFHGNAIDELAPFAHGYHEAGKRLARILADSPGYRDFDGYPILFLYRHSLELYMKAIIFRGAQLLRLIETKDVDTSKLFTIHRLSALLPSMKTVFDGIGWSWDTGLPGINSFDDFDKLVHGIEDMDPDSFNFRYPTNTKGQAALDHHTVINSVAFSINMDPILDLLAGAVLGLHEEFEATAEAKFELQEMIKRINEQSEAVDG